MKDLQKELMAKSENINKYYLNDLINDFIFIRDNIDVYSREKFEDVAEKMQHKIKLTFERILKEKHYEENPKKTTKADTKKLQELLDGFK